MIDEVKHQKLKEVIKLDQKLFPFQEKVIENKTETTFCCLQIKYH
jgi:hypothetical protein